MQNYADFKLSTKVAGEFRRQLVGRTDITTLDNGLEIRNARWSRKKLRFTASYVLLSPLAQEQVLNAFYAANAQLLLFRFRDIGDYRAVDQPIVDRVPGTKNTVQLYRTYIAGAGASFARRQIQAIVSCTVTVKSTGAVIPGVLDKTMGKFTPSVDWPVEACLWNGIFDCWVRFASDELDCTMKSIDIATVDVEFVEGVATL